MRSQIKRFEASWKSPNLKCPHVLDYIQYVPLKWSQPVVWSVWGKMPSGKMSLPLIIDVTYVEFCRHATASESTMYLEYSALFQDGTYHLRAILVISTIIIIFILLRRSKIKLIMDHITSMCMSIVGQHDPYSRQAWEQQWHSFRKPTVLYVHGKVRWQWKSLAKTPNLSTNEPFSIFTLV